MKRKHLLSLFLVAAMCFCFFGCGPKEGSSQSSVTPKPNEPEVSEGFDYSSLTIAAMVFQNDEFCRILQQGYEAAAKEYGVTLLIGNSNDSVDKEIELVNTYVASEVNGICVSILDADASVTALQKAHEAGIPVAITNTVLNADFPVCTVESSQSDLGKFTGMYAHDVLANSDIGKVKLGIIEFATLIPGNSNPRVEAFLEQIEDIDYEIVSRQEAWTSEMALQVCQDMLTANPDINVIFSNCDPNTVGATLAVANLGLAGQIKVFGIDASDQICGFVLSEDDILQGTVAQQAYDMGYIAIENLILHLAGETVEKHVYVEPVQLNRSDLGAVQEYKDMLNSLD
jgi:ABC-type sugar transport system substrate-binding protein